MGMCALAYQRVTWASDLDGKITFIQIKNRDHLRSFVRTEQARGADGILIWRDGQIWYAGPKDDSSRLVTDHPLGWLLDCLSRESDSHRPPKNPQNPA